MPEYNLLATYPKAKRNIAERAVSTEEEQRISCQFAKDYFDGDRRYGYGGYKYDGRWIPIAKTIIQRWNLKPGQRILDIGCAKGFLVKDLMIVCPGLEAFGIDVSEYAVLNCEPEVIGRLHIGDAQKLPFPDGSFDAAISINTIHNLELAECRLAITEMQRVAPKQGYIQVDSYRTDQERENLLRWMLTCKTHFDTSGWERVFKECGYTGDYYWTIIE